MKRLCTSEPVSNEVPLPVSALVSLYKEFCLEEGCTINSAIIKYMKSNDVLERISLANNYVGPKGLRPIIRVIRRCRTITHVDFDSNGADNTTVEMLCEALKQHIGVTTLILRGNPISHRGAKILLQLLQYNPRIVRIDVRDTDIPISLQHHIFALAHRNLQRMQIHIPHLVESNYAFNEETIQGTFPLCEQNRAALSNPSRRVWKASDASAGKLRGVVEAAGRASASDEKQAADAILPSSEEKGSEPSDATNTAGSAPPPASSPLEGKQCSQIPATILRAVHQRFKDRSQLYSQISESEMCTKVAEARAEAAAVERSNILRPVKNTKVVALPPSHQRERAQIKKVEGAMVQNTDTCIPVAQAQQGSATLSASPASYENRNPDSLAGPVPVEGTKQDHIISHAISGSDVHPSETLDEKDFKDDAHLPMYTQLNDMKSVETKDPKSGTPDPDTIAIVSTEENFQTLFDRGCDAYTKKDLDAAYVAWNDALGIAVLKNNREWVAVLNTNLQRLSYELVVEEGVTHLRAGSLRESRKSFETGLGIAKKAHNAAWVLEMKKALKQVQIALFRCSYEAGNKNFSRAQQQSEAGKVVCDENNDKEEYFYTLPNTKRVRHSEHFLREWAVVELLRDAVRLWTQACRALQPISDADSAPLKADVDKALDGTAWFIFEQHIDVEQGQVGPESSSPAWQKTSRYHHSERAMLAEVWFDILCYIDQGTKHALVRIVVLFQLANLYIGIHQLQRAEELLVFAVEGSRKLQHKLLEGTALTYLSTVYWLRSAHSLAEKTLLCAIQHWEDLLAASWQKDRFDVSGNISIRTFSLILMQNACNSYLVCVLAAMCRYSEALEQLEHALIHEYNDLLTEKMLRAFCDRPSVDQIAAISSKIGTPFVYYFPTKHLNYNRETEIFDVKERLFIWLVMPSAEMRFVEIDITEKFHISLEQAVRAACQGLLVEAIGSEQRIWHEKRPCDYTDTSTGIITTLPRKAWIEPLEILYEIFMDSIYHHIMILDVAAPNKDYPDITVTIIPTANLWRVPFHALLCKGKQFLVESMAVQLSFSATQLAFTSLNAERACERDSHRNIAVVPLEPSADTQGLFLTYPIDVVRAFEEGETVLGVLKDAKSKHPHDDCENKVGEAVAMVSKDILIRSAESLRCALSCSCVLHIAAPICAVSTDSSGVVSWEGALCLPLETGSIELVTTGELQHSDVSAELVTLTNTNMSPIGACGVQDVVLRMVRAFFSSGVPCVIAGQWCTPDMMPLMIFKKFYELLTEDKKFNSAGAYKSKRHVPDVPFRSQQNVTSLATSIRRMLKEDDSFRYNPRAWAGYYCFG